MDGWTAFAVEFVAVWRQLNSAGFKSYTCNYILNISIRIADFFRCYYEANVKKSQDEDLSIKILCFLYQFNGFIFI